jgi:hypothetical protein
VDYENRDRNLYGDLSNRGAFTQLGNEASLFCIVWAVVVGFCSFCGRGASADIVRSTPYSYVSRNPTSSVALLASCSPVNIANPRETCVPATQHIGGGGMRRLMMEQGCRTKSNRLKPLNQRCTMYCNNAPLYFISKRASADMPEPH